MRMRNYCRSGPSIACAPLGLFGLSRFEQLPLRVWGLRIDSKCDAIAVILSEWSFYSLWPPGSLWA